MYVADTRTTVIAANHVPGRNRNLHHANTPVKIQSDVNNKITIVNM